MDAIHGAEVPWFLSPCNRGAAGVEGIGHPLNPVRKPVELVHKCGVELASSLDLLPQCRPKLTKQDQLPGFLHGSYALQRLLGPGIPRIADLLLGLGVPFWQFFAPGMLLHAVEGV